MSSHICNSLLFCRGIPSLVVYSVYMLQQRALGLQALRAPIKALRNGWVVANVQ